MNLSSTIQLANGVAMPRLGLGVWKAEEGKEAAQAVQWAIETGYQLIDTAAVYKNEKSVGEGIRAAGVPREELFITTKVWNDEQGYDSTLAAMDASLARLGLDYVDLYLIHWPVAGKYKETWRAMEKIYKDGKAKAIGVSNFHAHHLEDIMADAEIMPMVNQVELHPHLTQEPLREFCAKHNIVVEAWSPLGQGQLLTNDVLTTIGNKYGKTAAQVILRWDVQHNIVTIPKSVNQGRIKENASIFDFELTEEEMQLIDGLNQNARFGSDPDNFDF
ncbi:aldo/keto reductase [Vagococcus acidifermentans]|uniref:Aldo/keto reductase n=1 Tax=Vagococcus acidifermentans TaxID=564710 RepID=A0A430AQS1_9ENTE|nr:aldo/keto reductase [Vagococcus acidifermentans]RSU10468.1 aldo/keto reductase [Vagococcus acidifermentans]